MGYLATKAGPMSLVRINTLTLPPFASKACSLSTVPDGGHYELWIDDTWRALRELNTIKKKKKNSLGPRMVNGLFKLLITIYKLNSLGRGNDMNYEI